MRDKDFFNRRDAITASLSADLDSAGTDGTDRIALVVGCLADAVLLLAQVIQERSGSGA